MITSSITAQCYPLRIIHNAIYTLNEIYLPLCIVRRLWYIFEIFVVFGDFRTFLRHRETSRNVDCGINPVE